MTQHSPKYQLRAQLILKYLSPKRLEEKWRKKTRYDLKIQFFPDPVENLDIQANIDHVLSRIRTSIRGGSFSVRQPRRYQVEKSLGLCRLMVQPSVEEAIILQCLSDKIYSDVLKRSPSKNAFFEPKDHSFRPVEDQEYGTFKSWKEFQAEILRFRNENKFIIVSDIANYYDFIDLMQLRNVVTSFVSVQEPLFDFLLYIISSLSWRPDFMPPRQIGLPQMDLDAPRLLAHCYLFELDKFMEDRSQKNYARFMDDIDAGVDTIHEAKVLLRDTDLVLQSRSLRLNAGKTRILSAAEAYSHFRVRDNRFLDKLEKHLDIIARSGFLLSRKFDRMSAVLLRLYEKGYFKTGNGEKILKRIIGIYNRHAARLPDRAFGHFLRLHPNLRDSSLRNASICGFRKNEFETIEGVFRLGLVSDDYFRMCLAKRIVEGKIQYDGTEVSSLKALIANYPSSEFCSFYGAMWILSRYGKPRTVFSYITKCEHMWINDEFLSRLIAGMWPRLKESKKEAHKYYTFLSRRLLPAGIELIDFHRELSDTARKYGRIKAILNSANESLPLKCTHQKLLVFKSVLDSPAVPASEKAKLVKRHAAILAEPSYAHGGLF